MLVSAPATIALQMVVLPLCLCVATRQLVSARQAAVMLRTPVTKPGSAAKTAATQAWVWLGLLLLLLAFPDQQTFGPAHLLKSTHHNRRS
jgi:hypothetical protein